jgi:hypothetical protein
MEDISNAFVELSFDIVNVKQIISKTVMKEEENQGVS